MERQLRQTERVCRHHDLKHKLSGDAIYLPLLPTSVNAVPVCSAMARRAVTATWSVAIRVPARLLITALDETRFATNTSWPDLAGNISAQLRDSAAADRRPVSQSVAVRLQTTTNPVDADIDAQDRRFKQPPQTTLSSNPILVFPQSISRSTEWSEQEVR